MTRQPLHLSDLVLLFWGILLSCLASFRMNRCVPYCGELLSRYTMVSFVMRGSETRRYFCWYLTSRNASGHYHFVSYRISIYPLVSQLSSSLVSGWIWIFVKYPPCYTIWIFRTTWPRMKEKSDGALDSCYRGPRIVLPRLGDTIINII